MRGAFIGFGNVARHGHLPGWLARGDVEIVAAADLRAEGCAELARMAPRARWYDSAERMLDSEKLDFADVCTPPAEHPAGIRAALERGLHVLCEKPLALSPEEMEDLAALAHARDRALATVHNWRHAPVLARTTELLHAGEIGAIRRCRWETLRDRPAAAAATAQGNWRVDPAVAGGGILIDHGWHALYMVQTWLPGDPERISARLKTRGNGQRSIEDTATVSLEFLEAKAEIFLTWTAAERANRVVLEGASGTIAIDGSAIEVRATGAPRSSEKLPPSLAEGSHHPDWFGGVADEFLGEIREPARRGASLSQARRCLHWIRAAYESSRREGEPLPVFPVPSAAAAGAAP